MRICALIFTAFVCYQSTQVIAGKAKSRTACKAGKCKIKLNSRLKMLRDLSKTFLPDNNLVGVTLKSLHNRQDGTFGEFSPEDSIGYDIPKLESEENDSVEVNDVCPRSPNHNKNMFPCPTPDRWSRIHCIEYIHLCDRKIQCPNGEDEDPTMCLFHQATSEYLTQILNTVGEMYRVVQNTPQYRSDREKRFQDAQTPKDDFFIEY